MTLKTRLVTTISMFFLVIALLITGVWAVSSANVNIGGTISFNATNIYATITGSISGATTTPTLSPLNYSANSTPNTTELNTWKQNLTFADATTPTIKWTVTIQNKSERALYVTLTDNISTLTNATKTLTFDGGSASGEQTIPAKTSKVYTMEIKVTDTNASASVEYDFNFDLKDASVSQNQGGGNSSSSVELKYDADAGYYYVEMGTYSGSAVRWRLVGVKESGASETTKFTGSTAPSAGSVGTFILETYATESKSFDANNSDYATSDIREYLNGDYKTFLNLTNDATYNAIAERTVADMYTDIGWNHGGHNSSYAPVEVYSLTTSNTESDKLWLMSVVEVYTLLGGGAISADGTISATWTSVMAGTNWDADNTSDYYWLRSPYPLNSTTAFYVSNDGDHKYFNIGFPRAVRPAFNLNLANI